MIEGIFGSGTASRIAPKLWQGGFPRDPLELRFRGFDVVILCAKELQPRNEDEAAELFPGVEVICAPMDDVFDGPFKDEVVLAVEAANRALEALRADKRVLVTCLAGRNRSGLVSALTLVARYGVPGKVAIEQVQRNRKDALTNPGFVAFLEKLPARPAK